MPRSTKVYGLDTSVFVRLLTGHPETDFTETVAGLKKLHDKDPATELVVSNQVIGEAYPLRLRARKHRTRCGRLQERLGIHRLKLSTE